MAQLWYDEEAVIVFKINDEEILIPNQILKNRSLKRCWLIHVDSLNRS